MNDNGYRNLLGCYKKRLLISCITTGIITILLSVGFDLAYTNHIETRSTASNNRIMELEIERNTFKKKYLREYDLRKSHANHFETSARVIKRLVHKYKIPLQDIRKFQACVCVSGSTCWDDEPCDSKTCPVCKKAKDAE